MDTIVFCIRQMIEEQGNGNAGPCIVRVGELEERVNTLMQSSIMITPSTMDPVLEKFVSEGWDVDFYPSSHRFSFLRRRA